MWRSGSSNVGSDFIFMHMDPLWLAMKESLLAVCILTGAIVTISKNRGRFPDIWLEAAESMSQMCESLCRREVDEMRDCTGIIWVQGAVAIIMMSFICPARCTGVLGAGFCNSFYTLLISHKSPRELEPDVLSMVFSKWQVWGYSKSVLLLI